MRIRLLQGYKLKKYYKHTRPVPPTDMQKEWTQDDKN